MVVTVSLILWAVVGPSVGMVVGAAFASRYPDEERKSRDEVTGRSPETALPRAPAGAGRLG